MHKGCQDPSCSLLGLPLMVSFSIPISIRPRGMSISGIQHSSRASYCSSQRHPYSQPPPYSPTPSERRDSWDEESLQDLLPRSLRAQREKEELQRRSVTSGDILVQRGKRRLRMAGNDETQVGGIPIEAKRSFGIGGAGNIRVSLLTPSFSRSPFHVSSQVRLSPY
jgi:hypothetical protein